MRCARETGVPKVQTRLAITSSGTLLSTTLAYLAARGRQPYISATFTATQVDFTKAGDRLIFIDDTQLKGAGRNDGRARLS